MGNAMRFVGFLAFAFVALAGIAAWRPNRAQDRPSQADAFLAPYGLESFSALYRESLETFLTVETDYQKGNYAGASKTLDAFWAKHPPGTDEWVASNKEAGQISRTIGLQTGHPTCYYALRMLTECLRWRLSPEGKDWKRPQQTATLSVVLVGRAQGIEPRTRQELETGKGIEAKYRLDPLVVKDGCRIVHQSLWLFREYMLAATGGKLAVRTNIVRLDDLEVPVQVSWSQRGWAGLNDRSWDAIWTAIPAKTQAATDWWWVLYPSNVPGKYPDFKTAEFVTGGMGTGPNGGSPCFIIDDLWIVRKPPHLGKGSYTDIERRAYLPQWLNHEFFHHLYRSYPQFGLEAKGHQWFDRTTWPADFVGRIEPDYNDEAMRKRLQTAIPPLETHLLYAPPPKKLFKSLKLGDLCGEYRHEPVENDWHIGSITLEPGSKGDLRWTNKAGKSWLLHPDLPNGVLTAGPDWPYYDSSPVVARTFSIALRRGPDGAFTAVPAGINFGGGLYAKQVK